MHKNRNLIKPCSGVPRKFPREGPSFVTSCNVANQL